MFHWLSERKSSVLFIFLLSFLLVLVSYHAKGERGQSRLEEALFWAGTPVLKTVDRITGGMRGLRERFSTLRDLRKENERIREELSRVRNVDPLREEYRLENQRLRLLLGLRETLTYPLVGARVTRRPDDEVFQTAILSIPPDAGVEVLMPVVSPAGLVGQIRTVSGSKAMVHLITDRNSGIAVLTQRRRVQGIVSGEGTGNLRMEYVVRSSDIQVGDLVLTSGLEGIFPKGIAVGTVIGVRKGESLIQKVELAPAVAFHRLEEVLVLLKPADDIPREESGVLP